MNKTWRIITLPAVGVIAITFLYWHQNKQEERLNFSTSMLTSDSYDTKNLKPFTDLRGARLTPRKIRKANFKGKSEVMLTCDFDTRTPWDKMKVPENFNPAEVIKLGQNPGLGVRDLHRKEITGKGVKVALLDFSLLKAHEEYKDKIALYTAVRGELSNNPVKASMHGAMVASLLAGDRCGVAPGATLFYYADCTPMSDYSPEIEGLERVIRYNKEKPLIDRIRVVTITKGFNKKFKRLKEFKQAIERAIDTGITVVYVTRTLGGAGCPVYKDRDNPENYILWSVFKKYPEKIPDNAIYVPCQFVTAASRRGVKDYVYFGNGGLSMAVPYLAGVIILGYQVNPNLRTDEIFEYIRETGTPFNRGWLINPKAFIRRVREARG